MDARSRGSSLQDRRHVPRGGTDHLHHRERIVDSMQAMDQAKKSDHRVIKCNSILKK